MERRKLIQLFALLLFSGKVIPASLIPILNSRKNFKEALFIEPTTVGIIMSIGKLFIGLFSSGPSLVDLLGNMNKQIGIINEKIDLILEDLKTILTNVAKLPETTVKEFLKNEIGESLREYIWVVTTINRPDLYNGDQEKFLKDKDNLERVKELITAVHKAKGRLSLYSSPDLVPYIALCIQMEYFLKSKLRRRPLKDFIVDIEQDQNWLIKNVFKNEESVYNNLTRLKRERAELIANFPPKFTINIDNEAASQVRRWYCYTVTCSYGITCTDENESEEIKELKSVRILDPEFLSCSYKFLGASMQLDVERTAYEVGNPPYNVYGNEKTITDNMKRLAEDLTRRKNEKITTNYLELVKTAAAYYSGIQAMEYCQNFLKMS